MKKTLIFLTLLASFNSYAYQIEVEDKYRLTNVKKIEFETEQELLEKINKLTVSMLENGYVSSKIVDENGKLKILPGRINKINLVDNSTKNPEFKKKFLGLHKLEGKILKLNEVEQIVQSYKKISGNDIKISIDKTENGLDSDVNIKNMYKPKINGNITMKYSKLFTYDVGLAYDQLLGLNDTFRVNAMVLPKDMYFNISHKINFPKLELTNQYRFSRNKLTEDVTKYGNEISLDLKSFNIDNKFTIAFDRQNIRKTTNITNNIFYEYELSAQYKKLIKLNKQYINLVYSPKVGINLADIRQYKKKDVILNSSIDLNLMSRYYDMDVNLSLAKNLSSDLMYDRYKKSLNIYGFEKIPLTINDTNNLMYMNNKIKYPTKIGNIFAELAIGTNFKTVSYGTSLGMELSYKKLGFNLKYSIDNEKRRAASLKLSLQF